MTRRQWMAGAAVVAASAEVAEALQHAAHAARTGGRFQILPAADANELVALTSQIIPSDDGPGAREAGVIHFIDRALATFDQDKRETYRKGLADVQRRRREMFPESSSVAALTGEQQNQLVTAIESTPFFELLRTHTVMGFLGNPSYGGNRGGAGWTYIGFEDRMAFQPPFGHYDASPEDA